MPEKIDLAIIAVGADRVLPTVESCGKAGVSSAIIISSGFAELRTEEGAAMEKSIVEAANKYDLRLLGPNNLGSFNMNDGMCASTSSSLLYYDSMPKGSIAWVSQSGAMCWRKMCIRDRPRAKPLTAAIVGISRVSIFSKRVVTSSFIS